MDVAKVGVSTWQAPGAVSLADGAGAASVDVRVICQFSTTIESEVREEVATQISEVVAA